MPDALSAERKPLLEAGSSRARSFAPGAIVDARTRLLMVLMGYIPLLHGGSVVLLAAAGAWGSPGQRLGAAVAALYLLPPLVVNIASRLAPTPGGAFAPGSRTFLVWWFCAQWQVIYNRMPIFEETLRLVPSLYSAWLRLWRARIGRMVYWSPGVLLLDRQWVEVGDRVVIGTCARIAPHYLSRDREGISRLFAAPVKIGNDAMVGAWSLVSAGASIEDGAVTRAARPLRPFTKHSAERRGGELE